MMGNSASTNFIVTIRAAGERTEQLCYDTVVNQAGGAEAVIIREKPFKKALEECFRIGINSAKKWLITVDADMILLPGSLELMLKEAEKMPSHYLQLQGKIADKITGNIRKAGPRIYRTSLLPGLLSASELLEDHIRPESRLITAHGKKGHPSRYIEVLTCLHDYEQYYKDIYRKAFVHAKKHTDFLPKMIENSAEKQNEDLDYKVILKALWDGLVDNTKVAIDTRIFTDLSNNALKILEIEEKNEVFDVQFFKDFAKTWDYVDPINALNEKHLIYHDQPKQKGLSLNGLRDAIKRRGIIKSVKRFIGSLLVKTGKKLQV
jgi:hypothetical protein